MDKLHCNNCGAENKINSRYCSQCGYELPKINSEMIDSDTNETSKEKKGGKRKILINAIGIIAFALAYFAVQQFFFKTPSVDKLLLKTASEVNKSCPMMVDEITRLDNSVALPNNTFQYNYTLINTDKAEVNIDTVKKYIDPNIINNVKTNPDIKFFRDHKTTLIYYYRDKKGEFVHKLTVTPTMYK